MGYVDIPCRTFLDVFDMQVVELIGTQRALRGYTTCGSAPSHHSIASV